MTAPSMPIIDTGMRLVPRRAWDRTRRSRVMWIAAGIALALHVLVGVALLVHPPAFLVRPGKTPPPENEATVDVIQDNMPSEGSAPVGATAKTAQSNISGGNGSPPPQQAQIQPQSPEPPPAPNLLTARDGETPPPQPNPSPKQMPAPTPPSPREQQAQTPQQPTQGDDEPQIRLSDSDAVQGQSGGDADAPAAPDPKAHNRLPAYPPDAARRGEQGRVIALINVSPEGTASSVIVVQSSGSPSIDSAAVKAFQTWRFKPAMQHGAAVGSQVVEPLNFVLRQ